MVNVTFYCDQVSFSFLLRGGWLTSLPSITFFYKTTHSSKSKYSNRLPNPFLIPTKDLGSSRQATAVVQVGMLGRKDDAPGCRL